MKREGHLHTAVIEFPETPGVGFVVHQVLLSSALELLNLSLCSVAHMHNSKLISQHFLFDLFEICSSI